MQVDSRRSFTGIMRSESMEQVAGAPVCVVHAGSSSAEGLLYIADGKLLHLSGTRLTCIRYTEQLCEENSSI